MGKNGIPVYIFDFVLMGHVECCQTRYTNPWSPDIMLLKLLMNNDHILISIIVTEHYYIILYKIYQTITNEIIIA